jgi:hypothetical protein
MAIRDVPPEEPRPSRPSPIVAGQPGAKDRTAELVSEAKDQAAEMASQAQQRVSTLMIEQKDRAADRLVGFAGALRQTARNFGTDEFGGRIGRYANRAADQLESMSSYMRGNDFQTLLQDTGHFARRRPEVFLGATLLVGLLAARFLKASSRRPAQTVMPVGGGQWR